MTKITYEIVEHDGGCAYRADGVFSETFPMTLYRHFASEDELVAEFYCSRTR
jgi:hypothetical protein